MARTKYITTQVTEETWAAIADAANFWGESLSKATDRLVQRGLMSLNTELGSKTPFYIRLARIEEELKQQESREQRVMNSYDRARKLQNLDGITEIQKIAKEIDLELP